MDPKSVNDLPLLTLILITYRQEAYVAQALHAALAQTYSPLEIIVCDDASPDATFEVIQEIAGSYRGPHKLIVKKNAANLGIGANLSQAVGMSSGELIVIAAGDDVSLPHRCATLAQAWIDAGRVPDLLASQLLDMDQKGQTHGVIVPTDLSQYRCAEDWLSRPPHVIGAAQAWTRRLIQRFGVLPKGVVAEDLIMVFRAICSGGALTVHQPLVQYRRGGLSGRVRSLSADETVRRLRANNRHALVEVEVLREDAQKAGCLGAMKPWLDREYAWTHFIEAVFDAPGILSKLRVTMSAHEVPMGRRIRLLTYAAFPWALAPFFWLKRTLRRG